MVAPASTLDMGARPPLAELSGNDDTLIPNLQQRLAAGGRLIKKEHLAVAVQLSRDQALEPKMVFKNAGITSSGETRKRILEYRDRILRDDLLAECADAQPLDVEAADAARRAKKAKLRHDQREHWAELRGVLDRAIRQLERQAERAERVRLQGLKPWSCPAGCPSGAVDCGRLQFRQRCAPTRAAMEQQRQRIWQAVNQRRVCIEGSDGRRHWRTELDPDWSRMPSFACSDAELADTQQAFLSMWDGRVRGPTRSDALPPSGIARPSTTLLTPYRWRQSDGSSTGSRTVSTCARTHRASIAGRRSASTAESMTHRMNSRTVGTSLSPLCS